MPPRKPLPAVPKEVARAVARAGVRLTLKQTRFAALVAAGASKADAYRAAYDTESDPNTVIPAACRESAKYNVNAAVTAGRETALLLTAEKGAKTREKISQYLDDALDSLYESGDHATLAKVAKVAGEQVHVQAFAKRREADDVAQLTDFVSELRTLRREMVDQGLVIDVQSVESGTDQGTEAPKLLTPHD